MRTPKVVKLEVTSFARREPGGFGRIIVRGPGQKRDISGWYIGGIRFASATGPAAVVAALFACCAALGLRSRCSMLRESTWTIKGLSDGLCFALYIPLTASLRVASAPSPYTVSVGNATGTSVVRRASAASMTAPASGVPRLRSASHHSLRDWPGSGPLLSRCTGRMRVVSRAAIVAKKLWKMRRWRPAIENAR